MKPPKTKNTPKLECNPSFDFPSGAWLEHLSTDGKHPAAWYYVETWLPLAGQLLPRLAYTLIPDEVAETINRLSKAKGNA